MKLLMKRQLCVCVGIVTAIAAFAESFPRLSNGATEYWYYLKFVQGVYVVASNGDDACCKSAIPTGRSAQLWKVQGSSSEGYTFTNKLGMRLYVEGTTQGSEVHAAIQPPSADRFSINARGSNYTIAPFSNTGQALNCWGGMGLRNDIKLYDSSDANAPMAFVAIDAMTLGSAKVNVVPYPTTVSMRSGSFDLKELSAITCFNDSTSLLANRLSADLQRSAGITLPVVTDPSVLSEGKILSFTLSATRPSEGYKLSISAEGISVEASDYGGFFNALQTLRQLMPAAIYGQVLCLDEAWTVPQLVITDAPAMHHRGFHLDVSRHFFSKEEVLKLLDVASIYKLNRFHWHLTDDQGWRIEIPEYPRLTEVGAIRRASMTTNDPTNGTQFFDDTEYGRGCYYTLDDLREVVAFARERNIEIIPEVDMPGHMVAALASYPELSCNPDRTFEVMFNGGISREVLNIGRDEVIDFLKCVLRHVAEVFPYELIHLGGDECPTDVWRNNADCARRIKEEGLSGVNDLQPWLVEQLGSYLRDNFGKTVVVWDELLTHWNSKYTVKPVVMAWRGIGYSGQAADKGLYSIVVPYVPLYLDQLQIAPTQMEIDAPYMGGYGDGTVNSVEHIYNFNPRGNVSGREQYVLGTQANLWTESCTSNREAEYQYYPRLLAVSEIGWLTNVKKDFSSFYYRLQQHAPILRAKGIFYAPHYFEPEELSFAEQVIAEASDILAKSIPGAVGYPDHRHYDALHSALEAVVDAVATETSGFAVALETLQRALQTYKNASICLPEADRLYQVVSAATFFRNRFDGSTLYNRGSELNIHYTPQIEPEELWLFQPQADGTFQMVSFSTGKSISITASEGGAVTLDKAKGSSLYIRKATKPVGTNTYIPGVVNIKNGPLNLYAKLQGRSLSIVASADSSLCYPGTWRIMEVSDYHAWLQKLVDKAERIIATADPHELGQPTAEALQFLRDDVIVLAQERLAKDAVSLKDYQDVVARYEIFLGMGTTNINDVIDEGYYYLIRNAYFSGYYASANTTGKTVEPLALTDADVFRWAFIRNANGTVSIRNKQTGTLAYVASSAEGQRLQLGRDYQWTLKEVTTDQGNTAIAILDRSKAYSWYTNPNAWNYVLLKPYDWGASVWTLVRTNEETLVGVGQVSTHEPEPLIFDLSGRRIYKEPAHGVYIRGNRKLLR